MKIKLNAGDDTPSIDIDSATVTIEDAFTGVAFLNSDKDEILVVALRDNGFEFYYYDSIGQFKVNQQRLAGALRYGELRMLGHHSVVVSNQTIRPLRQWLTCFNNEHPICIVCEEPVKTKYWYHARLDVYICDSCPKHNVCGEDVSSHAMRFFDKEPPEWLPNNPSVICYR
jgi:hypothetical protein